MDCLRQSSGDSAVAAPTALRTARAEVSCMVMSVPGVTVGLPAEEWLNNTSSTKLSQSDQRTGVSQRYVRG